MSIIPTACKVIFFYVPSIILVFISTTDNRRNTDLIIYTILDL